MSRFPETGLTAVLDLSGWTGNVRVYLNDHSKLEKAESNLEKTSKRSEGSLGRLGRALRGAGSDADRAGSRFSNMTDKLLGIDAAMNIVSRLGGMLSRTGDLIGDLGERAATVQSVARGFEMTAQSLGGMEAALASLREQSNGAVSDLELMRLANKALINSSQEFSDVVGPNMGTVIQAAFAGASATGQDLNIVLDKIVTGIRRQSNMLLDDIGIWVTAEEAQQRYAAANGLVASQLTEAQKSAAFAQEAIRQMGDVITQSGFSMDSMALASAQASAQVENNLNRIAQASQPSIAALQSGVSQIGATLTGALAQLDPAPFFAGGANIVAALANGLLSGLTLVVRAVTVIASTIADFLRGLSPPKKGPLHTIDIGGKNVISSWLDAFGDVSLAPVENLAGTVSEILTSAAGLNTEDQSKVLELTLDRVQKRLDKEVAALGRGEGSAATVQALDEQRRQLQDQLKLLQERGDLEKIFGSNAEQAQAALAGVSSAAVGGTAGGGGGGAEGAAGGDGAGGAAGELQAAADASKALGSAEKDRVGELRDKLRVNKSLQDQYQAMGLDSTDLLREEQRLNEQIAQELTAQGFGLDETASELRRASEIAGQLAPPGGGGGGGGGAAGLPGLDAMAGLAPGAPIGGGTVPGVSGPVEQGDAGFGAVGGAPGGLTAGISDAFSSINDSIDDFLGEIENAKAIFEDIDLFGAIGDAFEIIREIDTPEELIDFIKNLGQGLLEFPGNLAQGFVDIFTDLTGIELPGWVTEAIKIMGMVVALGALVSVLGPVASGIAGVVAAFGPMMLLAAAIGFVVDQINQRFGSFENALDLARRAVNRFVSLVRQAWEEFASRLGGIIDGIIETVLGMVNDIDAAAEGVGIDLGIDVQPELDRVQARQRGRELRQEAIDQMRSIMAGSSVEFSPQLIAAFQRGEVTVPEEVRYDLEGLITAALESGNLEAAAHFTAVADSIGATVPDQAREIMNSAISAQVTADPLNISPRIAAAIAAGSVTLTPSARFNLGEALDAQIGAGNFDVAPDLLVGILNGQIEVSEETRELARQAVDDSITGEGPLEIETAQAVIQNVDVEIALEAAQAAITDFGAQITEIFGSGNIPEVSTTVPIGLMGAQVQVSRSGGPGGGLPASLAGLGAGSVIGGRDAAGGLGALAGPLGARAGGGAGGGADAIAEELAQIEQMIQGFSERLAGLFETLRAALVDSFLAPLVEQLPVLDELFINETLTLTLLGVTMTTTNLAASLYLGTMLLLAPAVALNTANTIALTAALVALAVAAIAGTATLVALSQGFDHYRETVDEAIERTLEFIQIVNSIPRRIDVVLGVTIEVPNLTSLGAGIADALQSQDVAAIGGARAAGGPVQRGTMYLVGENGPELFIPSASGAISPIAAAPAINVSPAPVLVQGGGTTINQSFGPGTSADSMGRKMQELRALGVFG